MFGIVTKRAGARIFGLLIFPSAIGIACGNDDDPGETNAVDPGNSGRSGDVGTRCSTAGQCNPELICKKDFAGERGMCTRPCQSQALCPTGADCVSGIPSYNDVPMSGFCMKPCVRSEDCAPLGSVCDSEGSDRRLCF